MTLRDGWEGVAYHQPPAGIGPSPLSLHISRAQFQAPRGLLGYSLLDIVVVHAPLL